MSRTTHIAPIECEPCGHRPLSPYRTLPRVPGATWRLVLLCEGCGMGLDVRGDREHQGALVLSPIEWSERVIDPPPPAEAVGPEEEGS